MSRAAKTRLMPPRPSSHSMTYRSFSTKPETGLTGRPPTGDGGVAVGSTVGSKGRDWADETGTDGTSCARAVESESCFDMSCSAAGTNTGADRSQASLRESPNPFSTRDKSQSWQSHCSMFATQPLANQFERYASAFSP